MRKVLLLSFIALVGSYSFIACNDEIGDEITQKIAEPTSDYYQPYDSALAIALRLLNDCYPGTRSHIQRTVKEHYVYSPSPSTRATETDPVRFHVINFENGQGFAIVSADKRTTPVYAYSSTGNIDLQDAIQYSGVGEFMECAELYFQDEIERFGGGPLIPFDPDSSLIDLMVQTPVIINGVECVYRIVNVPDSTFGPLLTTEWHQRDPFNRFCPVRLDDQGEQVRCPAGCGPVAIGQIMAYHQHPANYGSSVFNWDAIRSSSNVSPNDTCKARLVSIIGNVANVSYGLNGTGITDNNVRQAFLQMGYSASYLQFYSSETPQLIKSNIREMKPLAFMGFDNDASPRNGHVWVVDGYQIMANRTIYYRAVYPYNEIVTTHTNYTQLYYHCNFGGGEDSSANGFFLNVHENIYRYGIEYIADITPID